MPTTELHDALRPLAFLIGSWRGEGAGEYPTIGDFTYVEESTFWHTGRPWLGYLQKTRSPEGAPMHSESGYLRPQPDGSIEAVIVHAFGVTEILVGGAKTSSSGARLELASISLQKSPTAKNIDATRRDMSVDGDVLTYRVQMAFDGHPLTHHLGARLTRAPQSPDPRFARS